MNSKQKKALLSELSYMVELATEVAETRTDLEKRERNVSDLKLRLFDAQIQLDGARRDYNKATATLYDASNKLLLEKKDEQ